MSRPVYYKCEHCGGMHGADLGLSDDPWDREVLDTKYGPAGWDEIRPGEVAAWRLGVAQQLERGTMQDYRNIPLYSTSAHAYELVWFEDRQAWFIQCTDKNTEEQTWSAEGYDTPRAGAQAFEGKVSYTNQVPGKS
jgi:hypothetical protein